MPQMLPVGVATVHQWWGVGESLGDITVITGMCCTPIHARNDADKLCELVRVLGSAACRKHVVGHVIGVVPIRLWG